jgi:hypothetical protein
VIAHKKRFEEEKYSILQQLNDTNEKEKRNLQLIQNFEQEIRYNFKKRSETNFINIKRSEISIRIFVDKIIINRISN